MKKPVYFYSEGEKIAANLYTPNMREDEKKPAIIVVTPWGGVKEQTAGIYASKLAQEGFITLAFDHRSYGSSEGVPRCNENPLKKVEDIKSAIDFMENQNHVDVNSISALGICSGAAYVAYAAATEQNRIRSIATISGYFHDLYQRRYMTEAMSKEAINNLMVQARKAKANYQQTGVAEYIPHIPPIDANSLTIVKDFASFYCTNRGNTPTYVPKTLLASIEDLGAFSAIAALKAFSPKPCMFVVGGNSDSAYESKDALIAMNNPCCELLTIDEANHTDLYDQEKYVNQVSNSLAAFYRQAACRA